tara:strand:- start:274 stop:1086 length:813 start_codon:yes stop_codon:yes gene_type:complete
MWSKKDQELIVFKMNRLQNKLELLSGNINNKVNPNSEIIVQNIYSELSETYIDIHDNTVFINENQFLWTSEKDGYNHLYLIDYKAKKEIQLTSGKWEVTKMYGYSANEKTIFFQAAKKTPTDREVYSLNIDSKKIQLLSNSSGTNDASFSSNYNYFINIHSDANNPFVITLNDNKGKLLKVLEDNKSLLNKMNDFDLVEKTFFSIPNDNNIDLNAWIMKPELLDTNKKHPLLIYVYGGPGINTVNNCLVLDELLLVSIFSQAGFCCSFCR